MSDRAEVLVEARGPVLWITIDRPARRNTITPGVLAGIASGLAQAQSDPDIRAVVLTGAGDQAFCAGADLTPGTATFGQDFAQPRHPFADLMRAARACTLPLVARVNGVCLGGGMGLLAMCDMAVAADHATFGLPEVKVGMFPMQVLAVLAPLIAPRDLSELCLTGEPVSADTADRMRLVNHVVPAAGLDSGTEALLARIVDKSPTAIRRGKYAMEALHGLPFAQAIAFAESLTGPTSLTRDAAEGVAAFLERRAPSWTGR
jgi:methylglutaconyl-CoA hydratase